MILWDFYSTDLDFYYYFVIWIWPDFFYRFQAYFKQCVLPRILMKMQNTINNMDTLLIFLTRKILKISTLVVPFVPDLEHIYYVK